MARVGTRSATKAKKGGVPRWPWYATLILVAGTLIAAVLTWRWAVDLVTEQHVLHGAGDVGTFQVSECGVSTDGEAKHCVGDFTVGGGVTKDLSSYADLEPGQDYRAAWRDGDDIVYVFDHPMWTRPTRIGLPIALLGLCAVPLTVHWVRAARQRLRRR